MLLRFTVWVLLASLAVAPAQAKVLIVLPIEIDQGDQSLSPAAISTLQGMLRTEATAAFEAGGWTVLRAEKTEQILRDTSAQTTGCRQRDCLVAAAQVLKVDAVLGGALQIRPRGTIELSLLAFNSAGESLEATRGLQPLRTKFQERAAGFLELVSKAMLSTAGIPGRHSPGRPGPIGGLTADEVGRIVRRHWNEIKYCYEKELAYNGSLAGRVTMFFQVGPTGTVVFADTPEDELYNANVAECMVKNAYGWKFPKPRDGGVVDVRYPFQFRSGE